MATYRKRNKSWRVEVFINGKRYSKSFPTKKEYKIWVAEITCEINRGTYHPSPKKTVRQALQRYAEEEVPNKKGARREYLFINKISSYPIADLLLKNANTAEWAKWRNQRLLEVSPATVRREITVIKAMYKVAINEWLWLKESPLTNLKLPKAPPARDRRISLLEQQKLLETMNFSEIKPPQMIKDYVALAFLFALETAMRSGEIIGLTWNNVYLSDRYVHIPDSKNGTKRNVALSQKAIDILSVLPRTTNNCFNITCQQRDANFRRYRDKAGIINLNFHDTRHEAITRLAKKIDIMDLSRMTGIKDLKTLMVYYNATASEIALLL